MNLCTFGNFRIRNTSQYIGRGLVSMTASTLLLQFQLRHQCGLATSGNDTCFSDAVAFQGLETLGLPYVEEQSLAHQVCLRSIFMSADWFWEELSSAVCSGSGQRIEKEVCEGLHNHLFKVCFQGELGYCVLFLRQRSSHQISTSHSTASSAHYNDIHRCWGHARANSGYQALILIRPGYEARPELESGSLRSPITAPGLETVA